MKNATATRVTMSSIDESALELPVFEDFALGATRVGSRTRDACDVNSRITAEAFKERGNEAYRMKDYARALKEYMEAYKMNEGDVALLTNMSATYERLGRLKEAASLASDACEKDPTWAKGWYRWACAYESMGEIDNALGCLEEGMSITGANEQMKTMFTRLKAMRVSESLSAEEMKERGNYSLKDGMIQSALDWYTRGIAKSGTSKETLTALYNNRAECRRREYEYAHVVADCEEVLKLDSVNIKAMLRMATAYESMEKYDKAIEAYERLLAVDKLDKGRCRARLQRCRVALKWANTDVPPIDD